MAVGLHRRETEFIVYNNKYPQAREWIPSKHNYIHEIRATTGLKLAITATKEIPKLSR